MTEKTRELKTQKILSRAAGLDDLQNGLAAYVGTTGKAREVSWLVYIKAEELDNDLGFPSYITITAEAGANLNDF
jgi:hypothetical protein